MAYRFPGRPALAAVAPHVARILGLRRKRRDRHPIGEFQAHGIVPQFVEELRDRGVEMSLDWFRKRGPDGI